MRPRISIRGSVRPSVGRSVGRSVGLSVGHAFVKNWENDAFLYDSLLQPIRNADKWLTEHAMLKMQRKYWSYTLEVVSLANWPCLKNRRFWLVWASTKEFATVIKTRQRHWENRVNFTRNYLNVYFSAGDNDADKVDEAVVAHIESVLLLN